MVGACLGKYEPRAMVTRSRYRRWFPTLPAEVQADVCARMEGLLREESEYRDECNFHLMSQARAAEIGFVKNADAK